MTTRTDTLEIKTVLGTDYLDVFVGIGWHNWTRIKWTNDIMSYIAGNKLGRDEKRVILQHLRK